MTRGQRNHNPLNIRRSERTRWLGQTTRQHDREFVQFQSDLFGFRAAFRIMRTYLTLHHLQSLHQLIHRWAPPEDGNNTLSYIETVSQRANVRPHALLRWQDEDTLVAIVAAMAWVESNYRDPSPDLLHQAYRLAR